MPILPVYLPVYVPRRLYPVLRRAMHAAAERRKGPNLWGDRDIENSFIAGNMPAGPGKALDFGSGPACLSLIAAERGFRVTALDLQSQRIPWRHAAVQFVVGDLFDVQLPENSFHLILNCSAIEHVGLVGHYGVEKGREDGDLEAMARLQALLKPGGIMLLTVPCGRDAVLAPHFRVYGPQRLPRLLEGYAVEKKCFWVKDQENRWVVCPPEEAFAFEASAHAVNPFENAYALGGFVLRKTS